MVDVGLLQSLSYVAAAIGVCVAAIYYAMNIRNAGRERRKQMIMMKLPPITRKY